MGIFDFNLTEYFENKKLKALSQAETEALLESLLLTMTVDGDVDPREEAQIMEAAGRLNWRSETPIGEFVSQVVEQAKLENVGDMARGLAEDIAARVESTWLAEEIYYLSATLAMADDEVVPNETLFLAALAVALKLTSEQQRLIIKRVQ